MVAARASLLFFMVWSFAFGAQAGPLDGLDRYGATQTSRNAICETLLMVGQGRAVNLAIDALRDHRLRRLHILGPEPRVLRNVNFDQYLNPRERMALAGHLRGLELWGQRAADPDGGPTAETPRVAGLTLVGSDQIEAYYRKLGELRGDLDELIANAPESQNYGKMIGMLKVVTPGFTIGAAGSIAQLGWPEPISGTSLGVVWGLLTSLTYSATRFQYQADRPRAKFDAGLHQYLEAEDFTQKSGWVFSSRTYRVAQPLVDAIWNDDRRELRDEVPDYIFADTFPIVARIGRFTRRAYVVVDHLLTFDTLLGAPRLTVFLRTSSQRPARVTARYATPVRPAARGVRTLAPDLGRR